MSGGSFVESLRRQARTSPDRVALALDRGAGLTFAAWEERSGRAAAALRGIVPRGGRLALLFDAGGWIDYAVAYAAARKVGAVPVPLLAAAGEPERLRVLGDCGAAALLGAGELVHDGRPLQGLEGCLLTEPDSSRNSARVPDGEADELLYRWLPLTRPVALARRDSELPGPPPPLLHAFPPGTIAGQEALRGCLLCAEHGMLALARFDAGRLRALIAQSPERACGLHVETARALLDAGVLSAQEPLRLRTLVLFGAAVEPRLRAALAAALPAADLRLFALAQSAPALPAGAELAPVAASQEGMLWLELFTPGCQNLPGLARRFRGPLDVAALTRALDEIVRHHEPLRSNFVNSDGRPAQVVRPHRPLELPIEDLGSRADADQLLADALAEAGRRPFDLACEPLFSPRLLRLSAEDHVLLIRTHHTVFDDWSVGVFRRQLVRLYDAFAAGSQSPLPEPRERFSEFARRRLAERDGEAGARELAFWRQELEGAPVIAQLAVGDPAAPAGSAQPSPEPVRLALGSERSDALRELARDQHATPFMTLLAAFAALAHRDGGGEDLLLSTVVANRNRTELETMIGCFTKKLPLRLRVGGELPFTTLLAETRAALLRALAHQDLPFEAVIQDALGAGAAAHGLVPHVAIVFQGVTPEQELVLEGLDSSGLQTASRTARAHFMAGTPRIDDVPWGAGLYNGAFVIVSVHESAHELALSARGAFHAPAMHDLLERLVTLLDAIAADPERPLDALDLRDAPAPRAADEGWDLRGARVAPGRIETALAGVRGVTEPGLAVDRDERGERVIVARGLAASPFRARALVWRSLPGYATPARTAAAPAPAEHELPEAAILTRMWSREPSPTDRNYWQDFSFLTALTSAREAGLQIDARTVMRNRTVGNLGAAIAAGGGR